MFKSLYFLSLIFVCLIISEKIYSQDFILQGWYWDYPKTINGFNWADTLKLKAKDLADAGFTYVWLPPFVRSSFGSGSNGYDPKDLFDLGEFGLGPTQFGTRADLDSLIAEFNHFGIKAVADVVYNHRDGGLPEDNSAVEGWIENYNSTKISNGDNPFPSDRVRYILPIGGSTTRNSGTYYFKVRSASLNSEFFDKPYKIFIWTNKIGWQNLEDTTETEPNGGADCSQPDNKIILEGTILSHRLITEDAVLMNLHLKIDTSEFNSAGDTIFVTLTNIDGKYADQFIYGLWYDNGNSGFDIQNKIEYQTYTNFKKLSSKRGGMDWHNFKPNGSQLIFQEIKTQCIFIMIMTRM